MEVFGSNGISHVESEVQLASFFPIMGIAVTKSDPHHGILQIRFGWCVAVRGSIGVVNQQIRLHGEFAEQWIVPPASIVQVLGNLNLAAVRLEDDHMDNFCRPFPRAHLAGISRQAICCGLREAKGFHTGSFVLLEDLVQSGKCPQHSVVRITLCGFLPAEDVDHDDCFRQILELLYYLG